MTAIAVGADHAGFALKQDLKAWLLAHDFEVLDVGTDSLEAVDYPDYAERVADAVMSGHAARGVLVCGTGVGMAIAANKVPGVRAAVCADAFVARMSREHNDANVLALGARIVDRERALEILAVWLDAAFAGGRHARRVDKVIALEQGHAAAR